MKNTEDPEKDIFGLLIKLSDRLSGPQSFFGFLVILIIVAALALGLSTANETLRFIIVLLLFILILIGVVRLTRSLRASSDQDSPTPEDKVDSVSVSEQVHIEPKPESSTIPSTHYDDNRSERLLRYASCLMQLSDREFNDFLTILYADAIRPEQASRTSIAANFDRDPELFDQAKAIAERRFPSIAKCLQEKI